ncbi:unnamed protein product [Rotaria magnacalcarata]|uniref:Uncharacterized protein n=8 Tax=Rotaria magnacalcarata TaxID=392030 RepID=A0A818XXE8_9BILA|nr:unnamed protein product [Rotaria magnacalcarata]CAF1645278.1 unnamed protein product [Rotaria magnacalcarata]CAF1905467.1 unnamed protein product [Rotaria magnacalcarata]CAF2091421.1 unnamed protein product [Rotaria magnacalcarata]CAF2115073.1 unnamed protein product [Rotaria magnacalcarata]
MSTTTSTNQNNTTSSSDANELTVEIPVWVHGKRKWVTGITKKTTFDDLIYALLAQADLIKTSGIPNSSTNNITGYAIAECTQLTISSPSNSNECEPPSLITQRIMKGRAKVIKANKNWQFDKLPLTILHLISTSSIVDNNSSASKFRSKIFRRFLSAKSQPISSPVPPLLSTSQSESSIISIGNNSQGQSQLSYQQRSLADIHENLNVIERQKRLLDYLDEKIHQTENSLSPNLNNTLTKSLSRNSFNQDSSSIISNNEITMEDVTRLFSHQIDQQDQLIFAAQLCNSILNMQERIDEKTNILYAVEQAISNELNFVLHQQHYDALPCTLSSNINESNSSISNNDLITLKNSIYRSRELSRIQSKEMHDFDLSLREVDLLLASKYDELKYLEYETSSNLMTIQRSLTPNYTVQQNFRANNIDEQTTYETIDITPPGTNVVFTSIKEADEDSGINSLTSDDNNQTMSLIHQKLHTQNSQLETLV